VKIYYVTQAGTSPPTFILFTNQSKRLHFSYERFLENLLRKSFDFTGTPIRFLQRMKEKRDWTKSSSRRTPEPKHPGMSHNRVKRAPPQEEDV
jgi:hypothetical protein